MPDAQANFLPTRDPHRTAMRVLAWLTAFRLLYLIPFTAQFDLAGDESYYWEWGRRLDWGYFSKPPMIGWLMGLVGRISNNSEWGIRCAALLLGTMTLFLLHRFANKLFGPRSALLTLLLCAFTPANALLNLVLTIDAPLVLCWTAALLVFWNAIEQPEKLSRWLLLSLILGLGHLSKQMMLVFPVLMILHCAFNPASRALLRRSTFWICIVGSLLFLAPVIWWNMQHGWVTLKHTSHHFETRSNAGLLGHLGTLGEFLGLQALAFSPVTWVLMIAVVFGGLWKWRVLIEKERYAVIFSGPGLAVFILLSMRQSVNVNWPAVYYISATVLAGAWLDRVALDALPWMRLRNWARPAIITGLVMSLLSCVLPFAIGALGQVGTRLDPALRLRGWKDAGAQAGALLAKVPRPEQTFVIVYGDRSNASQLAFYTPQQPQVFRFTHSGVIESQYELWPHPGELNYFSHDALIIMPPDDAPPHDDSLPAPLIRQFRSVEDFGYIRVPLGRDAARNYKVYLARSMKSWDPPPIDPPAKPVQKSQLMLRQSDSPEFSLIPEMKTTNRHE